MLSAARRMGPRQMPTLGVNLGKLGFLAEVTTDEVEQVVDLALRGKLVEEQRMLVECRSPEADAPALVLNDVVVQRNVDAPLIELTVRVGGEYVTTYVGDGVILATPVGSTAYSLGAGGPILAPDVDAVVLTPLAPHALPVRPLVVPGGASVEMLVEGAAGVAGTLVLDGRVACQVRPGDVVAVRRSPTRFRMLVRQADGFFRVLREKFGWAGSPRYGEAPARRKRGR
jgi:NAD+ kinase